MHIFPYSRRSGTPGLDMPGQVPMAEKEERAHRAAQVAAEMEAEYLSLLCGQDPAGALLKRKRRGALAGPPPIMWRSGVKEKASTTSWGCFD